MKINLKRMILILSANTLVIFCLAFGISEKDHFTLIRHFFNKNYLATQTSPGKDLFKPQFKPGDVLDITIDGRSDEEVWSKSQGVNIFYTNDQDLDKGVEVKVLNDKEQIVLFWKVKNQGPLSAGIFKNDSALVGDDYVQVNLKPIIPDSIKYATEYSFSIAVNPNGALWDAYFDPYHTGYFFTNWSSRTKLKTVKDTNQYTVEMAIPFSDLDIYSDPGWVWNLTFNRAIGKDRIVSTSPTGFTVIQNIRVRDPGMVGYYWTREEFWPDVIPDLRNISKPLSEACRLKRPPLMNNKPDNVWTGCKEIPFLYDNKTAEILKGKTAQASIGYDEGNIYFLLRAPGPYPSTETGTGKDASGGGMKHQVKGLDGIYRDLSLEMTESFWILIQPSSKNGDAFHQDYYFLTVDFKGRLTRIRYDSHGKPDREWTPVIQADVFKTPVDWGIELTIPLNELDIPHDCSDVWRMNIMYNIPSEEGNNVEGYSAIQAWYPTLKDEKNPEKTGKITSLHIQCDKYIRNTFEKQAAELAKKIKALDGISQEEINAFDKKFGMIIGEIKSADPEKIRNDLDELDQELGIAEEKILQITSPAINNDNYPLNDIHFINPRVGFAAGDMGLIMRTTDGGNTWNNHKKVTDCNLSDISFVNEKDGWIAGGRIRSAKTNDSMSHDERGGDGIILHTRNGGDTWEIQFAKRGTYLFGIFFTDSNNGWATGEGGFLLRTTDGGKHWNQLPTTGTIKWLNGIYFSDKYNGFLVGESETVLASNDGGNTWKKVKAEADRKFYDFRSFYRDITFIGDKGWIVGQNGTILSTHNRGKTWKPQATEFDEKLRELMDLKKVYFVDENTGYALGGLGTSILKTDNGGESWSLEKVPDSDRLSGAWFGENGTGFIVGGRSKILKTNDYARNWIQVNGTRDPVDLLIFSAHGDDSPIQHGFLMTYLSRIENRDIVAVHITRDTHSNEYKGEYYNYECDRSHYQMGVKTTVHFDEFDTGNSGCRSFHINLRLWKGYDEITRHMVAAIRAYRPDVIITHDPIYGEYDKPGHKVAGRAGIRAFYDSGEPDKYPELTRLGLKPHQPQKLYTYATEAFPATFEYEHIPEIPIEGYDETVGEWANRSLRCFQSQGVHFVRHTPLHLIKSHVKVQEKEKSIFDGLD